MPKRACRFYITNTPKYSSKAAGSSESFPVEILSPHRLESKFYTYKTVFDLKSHTTNKKKHLFL